MISRRAFLRAIGLGAIVYGLKGAPSMAASITLNPTTAAPKGTVTVTGTGWSTRARINITFDATLVATKKRTQTGNFSLNFVVPSTATAGDHTITATANAVTATATLTVVLPASPPPPSPVPGSMVIGLDVGKWNIPSEAKLCVPTVRLATGSTSLIATYVGAGLSVIDCIEGPYNSNGIAGLDPTAWANAAVATYNANPQIMAIEICNEPGGTWFWGGNAYSTSQATAYAKLLKTVRAAFTANGRAPQLLASYDGGYYTGSNWGTWMHNADPNVWTYVDGVTVHPYGGTSDPTASALGNRASVTAANTATSLPVWVTEVGWPTAVGQPPTGDSLQWSEADQATNITNFLNWALGEAYVGAVVIFNYQDYGTNNWCGVTRIGGAHKPSFDALAAIALP